MNYSKHCGLCKNEVTNLKTGLTCKLTKQKPDFNNSCTQINLDKKFLSRLEKVNLELERIKRQKKTVFTSFYLIISVGVIVLLLGWFIYKRNHTSVYALYYISGLIAFGVTALSAAYSKLNKYRKEVRNAEYYKYELDEFLTIYNISYTNTYHFTELFHGVEEVIIKTEFKNWKKKSTSTIYDVNSW